jgi:hypothetical protein
MEPVWCPDFLFIVDDDDGGFVGFVCGRDVGGWVFFIEDRKRGGVDGANDVGGWIGLCGRVLWHIGLCVRDSGEDGVGGCSGGKLVVSRRHCGADAV